MSTNWYILLSSTLKCSHKTCAQIAGNSFPNGLCYFFINVTDTHFMAYDYDKLIRTY